MSTLIYAPSADIVKSVYTNWETELNNPIFRSIIFTEDGHVYTHGKFFKLTSVDANPYGVDFKRINGQISLTVGGTTQIVNFPSITGDSAISAVMNASGDYIVSHAAQNAFSVGPTVDSSSTISVPRIITNAFGHVTDITSKVATLDKVKQSSSNAAELRNLLFKNTTGDTEETNYVNYNSNLKVNPNTGALYATTFYENNAALNTLYTEIAHKTVIATRSVSGHVTLSDTATATSADGIAATPKSVFDSLTTAKSYADGLFTSNDAMVFAGTIDASSGKITALNSALIPSSVLNTLFVNLTGYKVGWQFRIGVAGTIAGLGNLEVGDILICIKDHTTGVTIDQGWTVIQNNIDGAVITAETFIDGRLLTGNGKTAKMFPAGTNGQVLKSNGTIAYWSSDIDTNTWRPITVAGTAFLDGTQGGKTVNYIKGAGINIVGDAVTGNLTISNTSPLSNASSFTVYNDTTSLGSYNPNDATAKTLRFGTLLTASLSGNDFTINHADTIAAASSKQAVYSLSFNKQGHITAATEVTSMACPNSFSFIAGGNTVSFDGSAAKSVSVSGGGATTVAMTAAGAMTISSVNTTYAFANLTFSNDGTNTIATYIPGATTAPTAKRIIAGSNVNIGVSGNDITFSSINTWRNVKAVIAGTTTATPSEVLAETVGLNDLEFSSDFGWDTAANNADGKLHIMWAEIDSTGKVTYKV